MLTLVDGQKLAGGFGELDEVEALLRSRRKWLLNDNLSLLAMSYLDSELELTVLARVQCCFRDIVVCLRRRGHDNGVDSVVCKKCVQGPIDFGVRVVLASIVVWLWRALQDSVKFESAYMLD